MPSDTNKTVQLDFEQPLAVAGIGGLIVSTLISLPVIPNVCAGLHAAKEWLARVLKSPAAATSMAVSEAKSVEAMAQ